MSETGKVFIYWDNSNVFIGAQGAAAEMEGGILDASQRVRIHFANMLRLAHADRPVAKAVAAGSVPPELEKVWFHLKNSGVDIRLFDRGGALRSEQEVPDQVLQLQMLEDGFDNSGTPGTVVLLTGNGAGFHSGTGFHRTLDRLHSKGWRVEVLSWRDTCNQRMRRWVEKNGIFISLDDHYRAVTFMEPSPGEMVAPGRAAEELDLSKRPISKPGRAT